MWVAKSVSLYIRNLTLLFEPYLQVPVVCGTHLTFMPVFLIIEGVIFCFLKNCPLDFYIYG